MFAFIISRWKEALGMPRFRLHFFLGLFLLIAVSVLFSFFLKFIQSRVGFVINDPLIARIGPYHLCTPIQLVTYLPIGLGLAYLSVYPSLFNKFIWSFAVLLVLRALCLFFVPLEPPASFIELRDFILESTAYYGEVITKDLFFSGHVATVFLFFILIHHPKVRMIYLLIVIALGAMLVIQHVHYTIDVIIAPLFSFAAKRIGDKIL